MPLVETVAVIFDGECNKLGTKWNTRSNYGKLHAEKATHFLEAESNAAFASL